MYATTAAAAPAAGVPSVETPMYGTTAAAAPAAGVPSVENPMYATTAAAAPATTAAAAPATTAAAAPAIVYATPLEGVTQKAQSAHEITYSTYSPSGNGGDGIDDYYDADHYDADHVAGTNTAARAPGGTAGKAGHLDVGDPGAYEEVDFGQSPSVVYSAAVANHPDGSYRPARAGAAATPQLYAIPMAEDDGGVGAGSIGLPRDSPGIVVGEADSGAYEVVAATDGIYTAAAAPAAGVAGVENVYNLHAAPPLRSSRAKEGAQPPAAVVKSGDVVYTSNAGSSPEYATAVASDALYSVVSKPGRGDGGDATNYDVAVHQDGGPAATAEYSQLARSNDVGQQLVPAVHPAAGSSNLQ